MQSLASKSYLLNNAAKDDWLHTNLDNIYDLFAITGNDPGSAKFIGFNTVGVTLNPDGTFNVDPNAHLSSFEYTVQMANGTFSKATVHLDHLGAELLQNFSFESGQTTSGGAWQSFGALPDWTTQAGSAPLEVVSAGYFGINGDGHWLDTQASNGPIDIGQTLDLATGATAQLSFSVAAEDIGGLLTSAAEHLLFIWDGVVVADVQQADLGDYNNFHQFALDVVGHDGVDTLEIASTGADTNVGMALDYVSLHQWTFA